VINVAILGATGRMGRALLDALAERSDCALSGALASPASRARGIDIGVHHGKSPTGVIVTTDRARALLDANVAIDFTLAPAVAANVEACVERRLPLVLGTTGLEDGTLAQLRVASRVIPLLHAPNMSVGITVLLRLADEAARALGRDYDVEISDIHHRHKRDAPSGTALKLGETIAQARGDAFDAAAARARVASGAAPRAGEIGFTSVREGDHVGEHTVRFSGGGETVSLSHRATDRLTYARGAVRAAAWLVRQPPSLYGMADVISYKS
jgi:4-hydroxy-tetrahydrodipicolinate reductase